MLFLAFRIKFKDPQFEEGHVFKAVILPGAKYAQRLSFQLLTLKEWKIIAGQNKKDVMW